jgi:protein gp37
MGEHSAIEWTHHTFNPWWGCTKVSPACDHCYAERWARRVGQAVWGSRAKRRFFGEAHWQEPLRWNRRAERAGQRARVFCSSMADVFEPRPDLDPWRGRLWDLVARTLWLDWLFLTKRPEHVATATPWGNEWPPNVWLGTTVEDQTRAHRIETLLAQRARVRFLSCEPLLGPLDARPWLRHGIHWVIAGGESGPGARPMNPAWAQQLRDQCAEAGVAFHFKQWGDWAPAAVAGGELRLVRLGKKRAGRLLDGRTWDEYPPPATSLTADRRPSH